MSAIKSAAVAAAVLGVLVSTVATAGAGEKITPIPCPVTDSYGECGNAGDILIVDGAGFQRWTKTVVFDMEVMKVRRPTEQEFRDGWIILRVDPRSTKQGFPK